MWHGQDMDSEHLRRISVMLPPELVAMVDVATPTHRSRSVVVAEALQLWLEVRGIEAPGDWRDRWTISGKEPSDEVKEHPSFGPS